jgi:hypothetical protein
MIGTTGGQWRPRRPSSGYVIYRAGTRRRDTSVPSLTATVVPAAAASLIALRNADKRGKARPSATTERSHSFKNEAVSAAAANVRRAVP